MGIYISEGASRNTIGPDNIIAYNNEYGISINHSNSLGNTITGNSIHHNQQGGIGLWEGGNTELSTPFIFDLDLAGGTVTGTSFANCTVEIFSDAGNEGEVFEGQTTTDGTGAFTLDKGASFIGPHLTTTATDTEGNTSEFSFPTSGTGRSMILQEGNDLPKTQFQSRKSTELADNRMGDMHCLRADVQTEQGAVSLVTYIDNIGQKWIRLSADYFDWSEVEATGEYSRHYIDPNHDRAITGLVSSGVKIMYCLVFWDTEIEDAMKEEGYTRFKTEDEIQRYLDYVKFIVHHFKDRIQYYEILNEPNCPLLPGQHVELDDYINLVKRTVPIIRQEYPEAKIVAGGIPGPHNYPGRPYFFGILNSDVMPLVDAVSWHPWYGNSPEYKPESYYNYPSLVQEIKDVASSHGFKGEYIASEMVWATSTTPPPVDVIYSENVAAKYFGRGIIMNLGMDITVGMSGTSHPLMDLPKTRVIRNLCTVMAGADSITIPAEIESESTNIRSYGFSLPNGDRLLALWTDGVAVDDDLGVEAKVTLRNLSGHKVLGIDVLNSFQQELVTSTEDGNLVINNLLVKDYPIILHLGK